MMLELGSLVSKKYLPVTGTRVERFLSLKGGNMGIVSDRCIRKVIKLGEYNNSKLKALGVDTIEIFPDVNGGKRIFLKDSCGENILYGLTNKGVREKIAELLKAIQKLKELNPDFKFNQ